MIDLGFLKGERIGVMGLGLSGLATAQALARAGAEVWAWDDGEAGRQRATAAGVPLVDLGTADLAGLKTIVWSPGIPHNFPAPHPLATRAKAAGVEIVCDIELLIRAQARLASPARVVVITGTNGKSTTTALIGHILARAGLPVAVGGNIGMPALTLPALGSDGVYVLELSSYQLELITTPAWDVAALINITPDHLDRHGGLDGYVAAKRLIFRSGPRPFTAVIGQDDAVCRAITAALDGRHPIRPISGETPLGQGVWAADGRLWEDGRAVAGLADFPALAGTHNHQNAATAFAAVRALDVPAEAIVAAMRDFPGLAHRQQRIAEVEGVRFINDSKATNADAAAKALATFQPIYWILGGRAKETGLNGLEPYMPRVRHAFLIGESSERFATWLEAEGVPFTLCGTLDRAVAAAGRAARTDTPEGAPEGAVVLLSPAAASFDQFPNFEVRGDTFARLVHELASGDETP